MLFKMLCMMCCDFDTAVGKINIFKVLTTLFKEKSTLRTLLIMLTILDDPLDYGGVLFEKIV